MCSCWNIVILHHDQGLSFGYCAARVNSYNDGRIELMDIYDLEGVYMSGIPPLS